MSDPNHPPGSSTPPDPVLPQRPQMDIGMRYPAAPSPPTQAPMAQPEAPMASTQSRGSTPRSGVALRVLLLAGLFLVTGAATFAVVYFVRG